MRWPCFAEAAVLNLVHSPHFVIGHGRFQYDAELLSRTTMNRANFTSRLHSFVGALLLFLLAGCGSGAPDLAIVKGRVFYQGQLLRIGTVVFAPDPARGNDGPLARSEINADG